MEISVWLTLMLAIVLVAICVIALSPLIIPIAIAAWVYQQLRYLYDRHISKKNRR